MNTSRRWGIALVRITVGIMMFARGLQKIFVTGVPRVEGFLAQIGIPLPGAGAIALTLTETLGGLLLILGLATRLAAIPVAFTMLVALFTVHLPNGFFMDKGGIEFVLLISMSAIGLSLSGSGAFAVDNVIRRARERRSAPKPTGKPALA